MSYTFLGNFFSFHKQLCSTSQAVDSFCVHMLNKVVDFSVCTVQLGKIKKMKYMMICHRLFHKQPSLGNSFSFKWMKKTVSFYCFLRKLEEFFVKCRMTITLNRISASNKNECIVLIYETLVMLTKKYIILNSVIFLIDYLYFDFFKRARFLFVESFLNGANVNMSKCKCGMSHDQSQKFDVISMLI